MCPRCKLRDYSSELFVDFLRGNNRRKDFSFP
jgi:hypothetical protein